MGSNVSRVRAVVLLFLMLALVLAAQPVSVNAQPNRDDVIYEVQSGDRLVDIAARFGVSASAIVRANGLANADVIYPGQRLVIPGATAAPGATRAPTATLIPTTTPVPLASATSPSAPPPAVYEVELGDTLASIARQFGISAADLAAANDITNPDLIWVGQKLTIPAPAGSGAATAGAPTATLTPSSGPLGSVTAVFGMPAVSPTPTTTWTPQPTPTPTPVALPTQNIYVVQPGDTLARIAQRFGVSVDAIVAANGLGSADIIGVGVRLLIPSTEGGASGGATVTVRPTKFVASISQQRCWLYNGETVLARWICSTGRRGSPSVPGSYKIQSKLPKAYGSTWDIWMPFWLGIYWAGASENGIHGLPWDAKTGQQIWSGNVGKPITFGCIMLDNVNAKMLYDVAWIGMPVVILP